MTLTDMFVAHVFHLYKAAPVVDVYKNEDLMLATVPKIAQSLKYFNHD